jgi:hypothetical protein
VTVMQNKKNKNVKSKSPHLHSERTDSIETASEGKKT